LSLHTAQYLASSFTLLRGRGATSKENLTSLWGRRGETYAPFTCVILPRGSKAALEFQMRRAVPVAIALAATIAAGGYVGYKRLLVDAFTAPGQSWRNQSLLAGETVRLLESGEYVAKSWCDVCEEEVTRGRWERSGEIVLLKQESPTAGRDRQFVLTTLDGCPALAPREAIDSEGRVNSLMAYVSETGCIPQDKKL
jgi:hypothetical protein